MITGLMPSLMPRAELELDRFALDPYCKFYLPLWKLDGDSFADRSAYGHLCTNYGSLWTPRGRSFDGVDDYVDCGNLNLDWNNINFTVEAWAKLEVDNTWRGLVGNRFGAGNANWWTLGIRSDGEVVIETGPTGKVVYLRSKVYPAGLGWKHYVAVKSGNVFKLFISIISRGTLTIPGNVGGTTNELRIGMWAGLPQIWYGLISLVLVYSRVLTFQEILDHYIIGKEMFG